MDLTYKPYVSHPTPHESHVIIIGHPATRFTALSRRLHSPDSMEMAPSLAPPPITLFIPVSSSLASYRVTRPRLAYLALNSPPLRGGSWVGAHPWDGRASFKIHHSIAFKHQFITGHPPLGEILYPPLPLESSKARRWKARSHPPHLRWSRPEPRGNRRQPPSARRRRLG